MKIFTNKHKQLTIKRSAVHMVYNSDDVTVLKDRLTKLSIFIKNGTGLQEGRDTEQLAVVNT